MKKCKISPATLARTAALALALTNLGAKEQKHANASSGQLVEEQFLPPGGHRSR